MHDLRDSQTGAFLATNDRSMRTKRRYVDVRSPNGVQPDGTIPPKAALPPALTQKNSANKRRLTVTRKKSK